MNRSLKKIAFLLVTALLIALGITIGISIRVSKGLPVDSFWFTFGCNLALATGIAGTIVGCWLRTEKET